MNRNVTFAGNHGTSGGAVYSQSEGGYFSFKNVAFTNNTAVNAGGALLLGGGVTSTIIFQGTNTFVGNQAGTNGGAIELFALYQPISWSGLVFIGNQAAIGGAIDVVSSTASISISGSTFTDNIAT